MKIIKSGLILLSLMMMGTVLNAQNTQQIEAEVTQSYVQLLGKTPPVRTLVPLNPTSPERRSESKKSTKVIPNFVGRGKVENPDPNALPKGADPVRQTGFYKSSSVPIEPLLNIDGMDQGDFNATPPDPSGDIGHDVYLQMINATRFRVHDKEGNALSGAMGANTLWSSLGFNSAGDPIVLYDQEYKRWIMTEFPSGNQLLMAISDTQDPLGTWNVYNFGTPSFPDYPKYSIWKNAIVVTTNEQGAGTLPVYFIDRLALMNGEENVTMQRVTVPGVNGGPGFFVGTPVDWTGNVSPPEDALPMILRLGDDAWGSINQDQVTVYSFDIDFNNVTNTVVNTLDVPTAPFDSDACSAPGFGFACIPQLNGNGVDGIPDIIMNQVHYRNFISHESMTMNFIVNAGGDQTVAGIRWIEMRRTPEQSEWFVYQEGTFAPNDGMHRFMGGIAMDGYGNIGLAYNISSENDYVGMAFTGRQSDDPLGQMTVDEYILVEGGSTKILIVLAIMLKWVLILLMIVFFGIQENTGQTMVGQPVLSLLSCVEIQPIWDLLA